LIYDVEVTVIDSINRPPSSNLTGHNLMTNRKYYFSVGKAPLELDNAIKSTIQAFLVLSKKKKRENN